MRNLQSTLEKFALNRNRSRTSVMITTTLAVLVLFLVSILLTKPADSMTGQLVCAYEAHVHDEECTQLICTIPEHICDESCQPQECTIEHVCDENCLPAECPLTHVCDETCDPNGCTLVHICDENCQIPECTAEHICNEECQPQECTPHEHSQECYELVCQKEEHEHSQDCYEAVQTNILSTYYNNDIQIMEDEQATTEATDATDATDVAQQNVGGNEWFEEGELSKDLYTYIDVSDNLYTDNNKNLTTVLNQQSSPKNDNHVQFQISFKIVGDELAQIKAGTEYLYYPLPEAVRFEKSQCGKDDFKTYDGLDESTYYAFVNDETTGTSYILFRIIDNYHNQTIINENANEFNCSLKFNAIVSRDETDDLGDRIIHLGANETFPENITFYDLKPYLEKSGQIIDNNDGNPKFKWTITVNNPTISLNLYEYVLTDSMLEHIIDGSVVFEPADSFVIEKNAENKITGFKMNQPDYTKANYPIKITYNTPALEKIFVASGNYNVENKAQLAKGDDKYSATGNGYVGNIAGKISKSAVPDYKTEGKIENKLHWTIDVATNYKIPLGNFSVSDEAFKTASAIKVLDGEKVLVAGTDYTVDTANGTIKFAENLNQTALKVTYTSDATVSPTADEVTKNTAKIIYPNNSDGPSADASYNYKPYTFLKSYSAFNKKTQELT
ncbi:MAG: isopeptide-forming domain-containing fimbrial protein, partial [Oscillospiraceae bacterium]|nr:isopeptide-forming domain-containing fimbrial protein [Oscillospiraceae bacterium]